jgi:hypothetical protein
MQKSLSIYRRRAAVTILLPLSPLDIQNSNDYKTLKGKEVISMSLVLISATNAVQSP